ncbi:MAG: flagella basal body P-ring formation protein FlgA [Micavibrio sp.]|nr:flagella basal body P-ring formation protein FlgA [Micavibrio sp.]|tara:strand:+ start:635 stop:1600 length:966 start_codon:yes stop_codon:yes gene_type:complete
MRNYWNNLTIVRRITLVLLAYILSMIAVTSGTKMATAANLKDMSIVTTDNIMLKDLFDGVGRNANYVIGPAPQPGEDMVLNARTLYRIALAMDLPWRPKTSGENIIIRREATIVSFGEIEQTLKTALEKHGLQGRYNLTLNGGNKSIILPKEAPKNVEVSEIDFNTARNKFTATVVAPSVDNPIKKIILNGSVERLIQIPVLRTPLRNGMIIGRNDIEWIDIPEANLQHDTLFKEEDVIGLTPRRITYAGKPILTKELQRPQIVTRGETVTIFFKEGPLVLTAKGKSLQNGAKGDLVRITNLKSSKQIDAVVTAQNEVIVR